VSEQAFRVNPEILKQDGQFRIQSEMIHAEYTQLAAKDLFKRQKDFIKLCGGRWDNMTLAVDSLLTGIKKPSVEEAVELPSAQNTRKKTQAYKKWDAAEERRLKALFSENIPLADIAETLGRKVGAIRSRLSKLALIGDEKK
jgi:DNA-directed RNA polymerase specialized sigma24 family protein